ncbi:MAG: MarR family transcriptional regulator [Clostridium perfringens]|nr:MarR family transcriptional regulator [Clostridium perfringens]
MSNEILHKLAELYNKQDILTELASVDVLKGYGYSDIHCIDVIGKLENPNVTKISKELNMTRGAISKITKKQIASGLILSYTLQDNKKEIYFKLTDKGNELFYEHEKRHKKWEKRQEVFLEKQSEETLKKVSEFLEDFNNYLKEEIEEFHEKKEEL